MLIVCDMGFEVQGLAGSVSMYGWPGRVCEGLVDRFEYCA